MHFEEKNLNQRLINLTKGFTHEDKFSYRKDRNWEKFDKLTSIEKLKSIIKEIQEYKNGYIEEEYY